MKDLGYPIFVELCHFWFECNAGTQTLEKFLGDIVYWFLCWEKTDGFKLFFFIFFL